MLGKTPSWPYTFLLYISDPVDDASSNIAIYTENNNIYSKCNQASDLWQKLELTSELESNLQDNVDLGQEKTCRFHYY